MATKAHVCIVCKELPESEQPKTVCKTDVAKHPRKPMCRKHRTAANNALRASKTDARAQKVYGLPSGFYEALKAFQGGKCAVCQVSTGASKALSVDHDHDLARLHDHPADKGCVDCVRGLLCHICNVIVLGRYSDEALLRAIEYRRNPPMKRFRETL